MKNMRNENEIMLFFRGISWRRSSLLRELVLLRGPLPSFPYVTWLSLPFQCFLWFCHVFMFFWCRDIRFLPVPGFKRCKRGIFVHRGRKTHRGLKKRG